MQGILSEIIKYTKILRINDIIDIMIVAVFVYFLIKIVRETRAMQLLKGLAVFLIMFLVSNVLRLTALNYLLGTTLQFGVFALIVIFQPELRNILERMGRVNKLINLNMNDANSELEKTVSEIVNATVNLASTKTGALMVFERQTRLGEYISTGTLLDARISSRLLENIFVPNTPLHDGAVIMRGNNIITAGCVLPLTANDNISKDLGTRHRAAIGLSEVTDAVIVVVSEETGKISIALNGSLTRNLNDEALKKALIKVLSNNRPSDTIGKIKSRRTKD